MANNYTLAQCSLNQSCRIIALQGDLNTKMRLVNLGFHTRSHVKLILSRGRNLVIKLDGHRFALDKSLAEYIEVELLT